MFPKTFAFFVISCCLLLSCSIAPPIETQDTPAPATPTADTINEVISANTEIPPISTLPVYTPTPFQNTPQPNPKRPQYNLKVQLDYNRKKVSVQQKIVYTNNSGEPLGELLLNVDANRYWDVFQLKEVSREDGPIFEDYILDRDQLRLPLPDPLASTETITISISFDLQIPPIPPPSDTEKPQPFGFTQRQLNLVDWYPYILPYQPGLGWMTNKAWVFGEHQVFEAADFHVVVDLINPPEGLELAASSLAEKEGNTYRYRHERARNFALSIGTMYQVLQERVGDVMVIVYVFPFDLTAGQTVLEETADAVQLYSSLFGAYPHQSLSVVEADFLDGMEYDGLFFLSRGFFNLYDGTPAGYLTTIAVHEAAHMWWYALVGNDQANEPWLDEALATFSELLFYEHKYPQLVDWWWGVRINYYQPEGFIDGSIYDYPGFRPYRDSVYLNGAIFFYELREMIGEEAFYEFIQAYVRSKSFQISNSLSFFALLKEHTPVDLTNLINRYFNK